MGDLFMLFEWCWNEMDTMLLSIGPYQFTLLEVFKTVIFFSLAGWVLYKCSHLLDDD